MGETIIKANPMICNKCEHHSRQKIGDFAICLLNVYKLQHEIKLEDMRVRVNVSGSKEAAAEILTAVPDTKCPFLLEQIVSYERSQNPSTAKDAAQS